MSSGIEWLHWPGRTAETWNPWVGCTPCSPGCAHCWAARLTDGRLARLAECGRDAAGNPLPFHMGPAWQGDAVLARPLHWRKPRTVFVGSRTDVFHEHIPFEQIAGMLDVCADARCEQHVFLLLTKRPERIPEFWWWVGEHWPGDSPMNVVMEVFGYIPNVLWGVSVSDQQEANTKLPQLRACTAAMRFVSIEPLLGPICLATALPGWRRKSGIDWVIVGGESGKGARPMQAQWVRSVRDECLAAGVPFFFKQWGGPNKKAAGRLLDGREWNELPRVVGGPIKERR